MVYAYGEEKPSLEEALAHHGVKGMHWGVVREKLHESHVSRQHNRQLNKASVARDKAARNKEIDDARARYDAHARKNYLKAKEQFQKDKKTIGTREARKKFNAVKQKNIDDAEIAMQTKSGAETTATILATVGSVAVIGILGAVAGAAQARNL